MHISRRLCLFLAFTIGFASLVYEIYSTRALFFFIPETHQAITIAISAFLAGLAFSSLFFSKLIKKTKVSGITMIWWMQIIAAAYSIFLLRRYGLIPNFIDASLSHNNIPWLAQTIKLSLLWLYLFIPAFFIGGSFPIIMGFFITEKSQTTEETGILYFWDTLGAIIGSIFTGFLFIPYLGFSLTANLAALINLIVAIALPTRKNYKIASSLLIIIFIINTTNELKALFSNVSTKNKISSHTNNDFPENKELNKWFGDILFQKNSPFARITVGNNALGQKNNKGLFINYRVMCTSNQHDSEDELGAMAAYNLPENAKVLNIGLGCGYTANKLAQNPKVKNLHIAEINPVIVEANGQFFHEENQNILKNPKTKLFVMDGAEFLRTGLDNQYDAILIDIEEPSVIYSSPLFTSEYFAFAKKMLKPGGILGVWAGNGSAEYGKILYNTLDHNFDNTTLRILTNSTFFVYFSSDKKFSFDKKLDEDEQKTIQTMLNNKITDINTIENRTLEQHYNVNKFFGLPNNYTEPFIETK